MPRCPLCPGLRHPRLHPGAAMRASYGSHDRKSRKMSARGASGRCLRKVCLDRTQALEFRANPLTLDDRKLARERTCHNKFTRLQPAAKRRQLLGEPDDGIERVTQHGVASPDRDFLAVDLDPNADGSEVEVGRIAMWRAKHDRLLLRVVGKCQRQIGGEIAATFGDLQGGVTDLDRTAHVIVTHASRREVAAEADAYLVLEAGLDECPMLEGMAALLDTFAEQTAEHRFVHAELFLDRRRGQPDLPSDLTLARGSALCNQPELDLVRFIDGELAAPCRREIDALRAFLPESLDGVRDVQQYHAGLNREKCRATA